VRIGRPLAVDEGQEPGNIAVMGTSYVQPQEAHFIKQRVDGTEQIRIPLRRNWFVLLFLCFWICLWTVGGVTAIDQVLTSFNLFLVFWLCMWVFGWVFAASTIAAQIGGSEIIRVVGRDLEISTGVGRFRRLRFYRGDMIRHLRSNDPNPFGWGGWHGRSFINSPFVTARAGAIKFDYGSRTIYAATSIDEAEGRMIVDWLKPKLPTSATEGAG